MKIITLLSGIMGVGKSTFIRENNLESHVVSIDTLKDLYASPNINITSEQEEFYTYDKEVHNTVYKEYLRIIAFRMRRGDFIISDCMNINANTQKDILALAKVHGYRVNILDIQGDISLEQILLQNKNRRKEKIVLESVVTQTFNSRKQILQQRGRLGISGVKDISKEEFFNSLKWRTRNLDAYKEIVIVGDIHGCHTVLKEALGEFSKDKFYIFLGDFFDRGTQNAEVFKEIFSLMNQDTKNAVFIAGNHENHLINYVQKTKDNRVFIAKEFLTKTLPEFLKNDITKEDIRKFTKNLQIFFSFEFRGTTYFCNHGGILEEQYLDSNDSENMNKEFVIGRQPYSDIVKGIGGYEFDVDSFFEKSQLKKPEENRVIQFHGHRNSFNLGIDEFNYIYNLNGTPEKGGNLRFAVISDKGVEPKECKNNFYDKEFYKDSLEKEFSDMTKEDILEVFDTSSYIKKKKVRKNLFAYNFTRDAFTKGHWNDFTTTARGLFLDSKGNVFARGYNKFFNIEENKETTLEALKEKVVFPVLKSSKENGFLGILSAGSHLDFFTKSGVTEYSRLFSKLFYEHMNKTGHIKNIDQIVNLIRENNVSLTFEVISVEEDKHIVKYENSKLVLLDVISNDLSLTFHTDLRNTLADLMGVETPSEEWIHNFESLVSDIKESQAENNTEGYVYRDKNNYMFKLKSDEYRYLKSLRGILSRIYREEGFDLIKVQNIVSKNKMFKEDLFLICNQDKDKVFPEGNNKPDMFFVRDLLGK